MSRQMVGVFFPRSDAFATKHMPEFYDKYLPHECPTAVWPFAWWTLAPFCLMGAVCGLYGYFRVHQTAYRKVATLNLPMDFYAALFAAGISTGHSTVKTPKC